MAAAHAVLEKVNEEIETRKELMKDVSMKKKEELKEEFIKTKVHLDASYTEFKRGQDAALKAINGKKSVYMNGSTRNATQRWRHPLQLNTVKGIHYF